MATPQEIASLYQQILGREATYDDIIYFGTAGGGGATADQVAADLRNSAEYASKQAASAPAPSYSPPPAPAPSYSAPAPAPAPAPSGLLGVSYDNAGPSLQEINNLYQSVLGRQADAEGLQYFDRSNGSIDQIRQALLGSSEYASRANAGGNFGGVQYDGSGPTLGQINGLYQSLLGREADSSGLQSFDQGDRSIDEIRSAIINSPEYLQRLQAEAGINTIDRNAALNLIAQGKDLSYDSIINAGLGSTDGLKNSFQLAHIRSPAYQAMVNAFDPNYGTLAGRQFATQVAKKLNIDPEVFDQVAGKKFAELLANNQYSIYDPASMNAVSQEVLNEVRRRTGADIPESILQPIYDYNQKVYGLTTIPHPKRSGTFKQVGTDLAGGILDLGGALLKPIGLEEYAAPVIGAGITAASGGTLGPVAAAALGAGTASALPAVAAGDYSAAFERGLEGAALGALGGGISTLIPSISPFTGFSEATNAAANAAVNQAIQQGVTGGVTAGITGGDVLQSALTGAVTGAATGGATGAANNSNSILSSLGITNPILQQAITGGLTSGLVNQFTGKNFGDGALLGAATGGLNAAAKQYLPQVQSALASAGITSPAIQDALVKGALGGVLGPLANSDGFLKNFTRSGATSLLESGLGTLYDQLGVGDGVRKTLTPILTNLGLTGLGFNNPVAGGLAAAGTAAVLKNLLSSPAPAPSPLAANRTQPLSIPTGATATKPTAPPAPTTPAGVRTLSIPTTLVRAPAPAGQSALATPATGAGTAGATQPTTGTGFTPTSDNSGAAAGAGIGGVPLVVPTELGSVYTPAQPTNPLGTGFVLTQGKGLLGMPATFNKPSYFNA